MFGIANREQPYSSLSKLAAETFYFDKDAHRETPTLTEQVQRRTHLQRILRETNYALHILFGNAPKHIV